MNKNISDNIIISFEKIKEIRLKIKNKLQKIYKVKSEIKKNYTHYIKNEKQNFFGLDSFHFQNKIIDFEYNSLIELYNHIDNRIYGDYYKLFIMIETYLKDNLIEKQYMNIKELSNLNAYPIYKDLEKTKKYDFDVINNIHQDIISVISSVMDVYNENNVIIKEYIKQLNYGINIDNYIISHEYINNNLYSTNNLYRSYLNVYHVYHVKLLTNYYEKIKLFFNQINHNIVDDSSSSEGSIDSNCNDLQDKHELIQKNDNLVELQEEHDNNITPQEPEKDKWHDFVEVSKKKKKKKNRRK
jgi:hypothetical protein